jgi:hypothetical protein
MVMEKAKLNGLWTVTEIRAENDADTWVAVGEY